MEETMDMGTDLHLQHETDVVVVQSTEKLKGLG